MLAFLFSYHQVMPAFLDFIFPFGKQEYARDFYFSGLREESRLGAKRKGIEIPQLGRSGTEIQLSYNLRSVEQSNGEPDIPWSIRNAAVYHSFDIKTGRSLWINVKGNKLIKNRVLEASGLPSMSKLESRSEAFSASLATHLLFCDWSSEGWRWYINDLEDRLQALTRNALATQIEQDPAPIPPPVPFPMSPQARRGSFLPPSRSATTQSLQMSTCCPEALSPRVLSRATTLFDPSDHSAISPKECYTQKNGLEAGIVHGQGAARSLRPTCHSLKGATGRSLRFWEWCSAKDSSLGSKSTEKLEPVTPALSGKMAPPELPPTMSNNVDQTTNEAFTFRDLKRIQYIEEKAQDALLVLKLNVEVLEELRQHYAYSTRHAEFPTEIKHQCEADLARFDKCVRGVEKDLRMMQSRTETLLHLVANRSNLVSMP
jgi:hypothetical protein